jgi:hypothetical protein
MDVFQWTLIAADSIKKNTVAATIEMEMIQKEMATASLGLRNPCNGIVQSAPGHSAVDILARVNLLNL